MRTMLAALCAAFCFCFALSAQGPLVNGTSGSDGANLCMAVGGNIAPGSPVIAASCVTGLSNQQFTVTPDGGVHAGAANSSLCVAGVARPNGIRNFSPGTLLALVSCSNTRRDLYSVDSTVFSRGGQLCVVDGDTSTYCFTTSSSTAGQPLVLNFASSLAVPVNQKWSGTITARRVSLNLNPSSLFNSQGCLLDLTGQPIAALGCGLVAIGGPTQSALLGSVFSAASTQVLIKNIAVATVGNGGKIVAQGGGNIVAQGGGNIVAQGGGNVVPSGTTVQIQDVKGNPVPDAIITNSGSNIVAQGGGNIVAQGGGNIVSGGNYSGQSLNGSFAFSTGATAAIDATANALQQALLVVGNNAYKGSTPTTPYAVTGVSADPGPWAPGSTHTVTWQGTGAAASGETIYVYFQTSSQNLTLCSNIAPSAGRCSVTAPNLPGSSGSLDVWDSVSRKNAYVATQIQISAPPAQAYNVTAVSADAGPWAPGSTHTVSWQGSGAAASGETIYVYFQTSTQNLTLCSNVAPSAGACSVTTPNMPGTSGAIDVWDSLSRKNAYVASQIQIAAPVVTPPTQPFNLSAVFRVDGNVPAPNANLAWAATSGHQLQWSWTGTAASNETVSFWLGSLRLAYGIPALQGNYNLPASSVRSGSAGVLVLRDDLTGKQVNGPNIQVR